MKSFPGSRALRVLFVTVMLMALPLVISSAHEFFPNSQGASAKVKTFSSLLALPPQGRTIEINIADHEYFPQREHSEYRQSSRRTTLGWRSELATRSGFATKIASLPSHFWQAAPIQETTNQKQTERSDRRTGGAVDARDEFDRTPLMRAAARNDLPAAKELLARDADVNAKTADGYTILMYAAFYGSAEIVEFLLENGAAVNARDDHSLTALIEAAKQNMDAGDVVVDYVGTVKALLKRGADVSPRDKDGNTALMYAEKYGLRNRKEIVEMLKNAGAKQ